MKADSKDSKDNLFEYVLRLGDDRLILGHRLSEWCGHGPILEEDIALANISLDCIGQANNFLQLAASINGNGQTADDLAYFRDTIEFRNLMLTELPNGDFACTIARQFLFDVFSFYLLTDLQESKHDELAGLAAKSLKEVRYHLRHSSEWMLRLGDGTEESHNRIQTALNDIWMYTGESFKMDDVDQQLLERGIAADLQSLKPKWKEKVSDIIKEATLILPDDSIFMVSGSRRGNHTEHFGHLLTEMQILPRSLPDAKW